MLTPSQTQDLVSWAGGQQAAARAIGVSQGSVWYWLNPETARERSAAAQRRYMDTCSGVTYNRKLLRNRRWRAMRAMAERNADRLAK